MKEPLTRRGGKTTIRCQYCRALRLKENAVYKIDYGWFCNASCWIPYRDGNRLELDWIEIFRSGGK